MQRVENESVVFVAILVGEEGLGRAWRNIEVTKRDANGLFRVVEDEVDVTFESNILVEDDSGVRWNQDRAHSATEHESIGLVIRSTGEVLLKVTFAVEIKIHLDGLFDAARLWLRNIGAHVKLVGIVLSGTLVIGILDLFILVKACSLSLGGTGKSESSDNGFHHCCL